MSSPTIHLIATIRFLTEAEGGRHTPTVSGYRGQFYYDDQNWMASYQFAVSPAPLGEPIETMITLVPEHHIGKLFRNQGFEIREGAKTVAHGMITWVDDSLKA